MPGPAGDEDSSADETLIAGNVATRLSNRGWTSASLDLTRRSIQFRRGFLWVKQYVLPISSVHVMMRNQGPLGRHLGVSNVSLLMYDGRRVWLRLLGCSEQLAVGIGHAVLGGKAFTVGGTHPT